MHCLPVSRVVTCNAHRFMFPQRWLEYAYCSRCIWASREKKFSGNIFHHHLYTYVHVIFLTRLDSQGFRRCFNSYMFLSWVVVVFLADLPWPRERGSSASWSSWPKSITTILMDGNAGRYHPMPAWTHFVPNYNSFDFFDLKFDHSFYLKKLCKYSQIYVIF